MGIIIGIDVGGSTTKIVGFDKDKRLITPMIVKATDPVASCYGAFGKFTSENGIKISDVERIMITGVGSSFVDEKMFGIPTQHVTEFTAVGLGGLYLSGLSEAVIVSMGTGTAITYAKGDELVEYLGGTGVGGGTLIGLSKELIGVSHVDHIVDLAKEGDVSNIDLKVGDITKNDILPGLSAQVTAANFGKVSDIATKGDIALGLFNLIFESIGMLAIFAARSKGLRDIVLIGNLAVVPQAEYCFGVLNEMFGMNFVLPENKQFGTAIGTALSYFKENA